jgi:Arc/MetJ-type ribon-helix-helix transcriptional regulator
MHFEGYVERIINEAVRQGVVKTKAEALRAGLLELNDKYVLVPSLDEMEDIADMEEISKIEARINAGKEKVHKVKNIEELLK